MKLFFSLFTILLLSVACSENKEVKIIKKVHVEISKQNPVIPTRELRVEIKGMMCEIGCGGSIRKELKASGHVSRVQYDFVEGRKTQIARIEYDSKQITKDAILAIINGLNDQQFKTKLLSDNSLEIKSSNCIENDIEQRNIESNFLKTNENTLKLPSLLEIISSIL